MAKDDFTRLGVAVRKEVVTEFKDLFDKSTSNSQGDFLVSMIEHWKSVADPNEQLIQENQDLKEKIESLMAGHDERDKIINDLQQLVVEKDDNIGYLNDQKKGMVNISDENRAVLEL